MKSRKRLTLTETPKFLKYITSNQVFVDKVGELRDKWKIPEFGFEDNDQYFKWLNPLTTKTTSPNKSVFHIYQYWDFKDEVIESFPALDKIHLNAIYSYILFGKLPIKITNDNQPIVYINKDKSIVCVEVKANTTKEEYHKSFSQVVKLQKKLPTHMKGMFKTNKNFERDIKIIENIEEQKNKSPNNKKTIRKLALDTDNMTEEAYRKVKPNFDKKVKKLLERISLSRTK